MNNRNIVAAILAIMALIGFLAVVACIATQTIPVGNKDYFNTALIALIGIVGTAFGYYLGSSQSSADKTALLAPPITPVTPVTPSTPITPSTQTTED